jgi:hypothetical protein
MRLSLEEDATLGCRNGGSRIDALKSHPRPSFALPHLRAKKLRTATR